MKKFCKKIYSWTVELFQSVVSIISVCLFSSFNAARSIRKLAKENGKKKCIVLGNGPSLKEALELYHGVLKEYDTVAVNTFCAHNDFKEVKPKYYVLTDPGFFDDKTTNDRIIQLQRQVQQGFSLVDWEMVLLLPSINRKSSLVQSISNRYITVCFYNVTPINGCISLQHTLFNKNLGMPTAMSVVCAAVFLMILLHYSDIYVVGADHNMIKNIYVNENNELMLRDEHFYGERDLRIDYSICKYVESYAECMKTHERIAEYAKYKVVNIWNASKGSFIDAYPRRLLSSL